MEYLVIDTESCTGKDNDGSLCSIGYCVCDENLNIIKQEDVLFNPMPRRFSVGDKKNAKRTGIKFAYEVEDFRKAPRFIEKYEFVKSLFQSRTVIGFAMVNDVKYLNDACDKYGVPRIQYEFIDAQFIYSLLHPEANSIGLKTLGEKYDLKYTEHRSDDDAAVSVTLLKKILEQEGISLNDVLIKYSVHNGVNDELGYHMNYSDALNTEKFGLKRSKKIQSILFADYVAKQPQKRGKGRICFSYKIEKSDVNYTRTLVKLITEKGYSFTRDADACSIFVVSDSEENDKRKELVEQVKKRKITIMMLGDFEKFVGYEKDNEFDDTEFLAEYYETRL